MTVTVLPFWAQLPFQPPVICCHPVGQAKVSVQPSIGWVPLLVMSMLPTYPLLQSVTSVKRTAHVLVAGVPVTKVSGGEAAETRPALSRVRTLTV